MKRLILIIPILFFLFSSCDSPISDAGSGSESSILGQARAVRQMAVLTHTPAAKMDSVRQELALQFSARHGQGWKTSWSKNKTRATPVAVFGGTTQPVHGSPEKAARAFLAQNRNLFNMHKGLSDLKLTQVKTSSKGIRHVHFQQSYHNIPVYEAGYNVHIRPDGRIDMANGHYYQNIKAPTSAGISSGAAKRTALDDLRGKVKLKWKTTPKLMIYRNPKDKKFSLVWKVVLPTSEPVAAVWQYFVDAGSGQILHKLNLAPSITGDAEVITDNPVTTPTPANRNLYRLDGSGHLQGTYANVHNDVADRAYSSTNYFVYPKSSTHFDEANVYYYIDTYRQDYLNTIGFAGVDIGSDLDLEAAVHARNVPLQAVARYIPGSGHEEIRFAQVTAGPRSAKVTYHEMTHAVADMENGHITCNQQEEGSICEGLADYFPDSYTHDSKIGIALPPARDAENPFITSYSQFESELPVDPHRGGTLFSAILWDIRNNQLNGSPSSEGNITHHAADEDIFQAIGRVSHSADFLEFRDAMIAADNENNGGSHADFIQDAFAARGVGNPVPPPQPPLTVSVSGSSSLFNGQQGTWTASPSGGTGTYSYYYWDYRYRCLGCSNSSWSYWTPINENSNTVTRRFENDQNEVRRYQIRCGVISGYQSVQGVTTFRVIY